MIQSAYKIERNGITENKWRDIGKRYKTMNEAKNGYDKKVNPKKIVEEVIHTF